MPLTAGTFLGSYKIVAPLGAGGMGEVYRARDAGLNRDIAIKVLPDVFAGDPDRLARFQREAHALAALNHPNIAQIYGLEGSGSTRALVMELVEGQTLANRIARGPIPVRDAMPIAKQIAEALEAAHERGIIHRDLKPANIKTTPAGVVKVLDFGLAKMHAGDDSDSHLSQSPTVTGATCEGVVLGTPAYMSPEQARGLAVDRRTDIWAFGCVLFEMLTGRAPFRGDTLSDTIARVLEREPDWETLPTATPSVIRRLVRRCLDKDLRRRLQHVGDARIDIEDALGGALLDTPGAADSERRSVHLPWMIAAVSSVVASVAVATLTWKDWTPPPQTAPPRISRMTLASSGPATVAVKDRSLAITPDGMRVVYIGNNHTQLFVRPLDRLDSTAIFTSVAPLNFVFVSPDGQWVGFWEGQVLKKVALTGGPSVTVVRHPGGLGATWTPDDTIIFATPTGLVRVSVAGGDVSALTRPATSRGELGHLWPEILPGGRAVLFTILSATGGLNAAQVAVLDLASGTQTVLVPGGSHAHYVESGHLVYVSGGTLCAVPFDLERLTTRGAAVTMLPRLLTSPEGAGAFVVAVDGTLAYVDAPDATAAAVRTLVWVDRQGREEALGTPGRPYFHPSVSPSGTRIAVAIADQEQDIWIWDVARRVFSRLTFTPSPLNERAPVWTSDGKRLAFFLPNAAGGSSLFWQLADGRGASEGIADGPASGVTPDGRLLFSPGARDLMVLALDGTRRVHPLLQTPAAERNGVVTSDGRWLAYESDRSGQFEIYVAPFPNASAKQWLTSSGGGTRPLWAASGQELFYVAPDGAIMAVRVTARGDAWSAGSPAKVVEGPYVTGTGTARTYDVSPDGRRFLMVKEAPAVQAATAQIVVVLNWYEELKRLVR